MTGRARKLSAAERSRREFHAYTDTSSLEVLFRCQIFVSQGGESEGRGGLRIAPVFRGSADFHFLPWSNGKAMNDGKGEEAQRS